MLFEKIELRDGEQIIKKVNASYHRGQDFGIISNDGEMKITNQRIIFKPFVITSFLSGEKTLEIPLENIIDVEKRKTLIVLENGMQIKLRSGVGYKFTLNNRDLVVNLIKEHSINKSLNKVNEKIKEWKEEGYIVDELEQKVKSIEK